MPGRLHPPRQHPQDPDKTLRPLPYRLLRRQLPVLHRPSSGGGVVLPPPPTEREGAGGPLEPALHRERDVPPERQERHPAAGDSDGGGVAVRPGEGMIIIRFLFYRLDSKFVMMKSYSLNLK